MEGMDLAPQQMSKFVKNVKDKLEVRFIKNYDPAKGLTPFGWLTTGRKAQTDIIFRAKGDVMVEFKKQITTTSYDVPGFSPEIFKNYSTESDINYTRSDLKHTTRDIRERLDLKDEKGKRILDKKVELIAERIANEKAIEKFN